MKQVFYKGLLALTIAFGVTSCDKNELDDIAAPTVGVVVNDEYSKVSFGETTGIIAPKGESNEAGKNAADFASLHVYAPATSPQVLTISNAAGVQYTGSYPAGSIGSIVPSDIILANGDYTAMSVNPANAGLGLVSGFAPYTSASGSFNLSASASIQLDVTHDRGFVIADSQRADGGLRITSVVLSQPAVGDIAAKSGNLILDESDEFGDYYGYLEAGTYGVVINYMLDGSAESVTGSVEIINGVASTLAPMLTPETPVSSETTTSTQSINEADLAGDDLADYGNNDGDFLDSISRVVSSTITTTSGSPAPAVIENGPWTITSNIDISVSSAVVTSTEDVLRSGAGLDVNEDGDMRDHVTRTVTTTTQSVDGTAGTPDIDESPWAVLEGQNRNVLGVDEDATPGDTAPFVDATFSEWGPAFGTQIDGFTQERTVSNSDANLDGTIVLELSRDITVAGVVSTPAAAGVAGVMTYSATDADGAAVGISHEVAIDALPDYVAATYSVWGPAFSAAHTADFAQTREVSNSGANLDADATLEALSRDVVVSYDVTLAPLAGVAGVGTYSADNGITFTHTVVIAALPPADVDVTWTDSTASGKTSYVGSDTDYNFAVEGALTDVIVSGIDFPEDIIIVVPGYFNGVALPGLPTASYTLRNANKAVIGAPIDVVVALIQAAINQ